MGPQENGCAPGPAGARPQPSPCGPRGLIDRTEYVRVLEQALRALGYEDCAQRLEAASGVQQQPAEGAAFRSAVLAGDFDAALRLLPAVAADAAAIDTGRYLLLRRKYEEGVVRGETAAALQVLRRDLQPLQQVDAAMLHQLAALLLRSPGAAAPAAGHADPVAAPANGNSGAAAVPAAAGGAAGGGSGGPSLEAELRVGRAALLGALAGEMLPSLLLPERRLEELLEQALLAQLERSPYHNSPGRHLSLLRDYAAGAEQLPSVACQVLEDHSGEVWCVAFSPDGLWAASASKDGSSLLWAVTPGGCLEGPRPLARALPAPCNLVAFSPSSALALVASLDGAVRCYDVATTRLLRQWRVGEDGGQSVVALSWFPDSASFLAATHRGLGVWGLDGGDAPLRRLQPPHAFVYDAAVWPGGNHVVTVGEDRRVAFMRLSDGRCEAVREAGTVTSLHLSACGRWLAANLTDAAVHAWRLPDLAAGPRRPHAARGGDAGTLGAGLSNGLAHASGGGRGSALGAAGPAGLGGAGDPLDALPTAPAYEFTLGPSRRPNRFVLRCCVGGARSGFVAAGSEESTLYIWSLRTGEQLAQLAGHRGCINGVAWNPANPFLLASAGDDGTVRTWLAPAARQR